MKRVVFIAVFLMTLSAWAVAQDAPNVDGDSLWERITVLSPYTNWDQWPDHVGLQDGAAPHGPKHIVYVNKTGLEPGVPKPYNTIVVKENYTPEKKLAALTVMYKVKGYNPEAGDWFWVKYAPDGTVQKQGKPAGCIGCHAASGHDYLMVTGY